MRYSVLALLCITAIVASVLSISLTTPAHALATSFILAWLFALLGSILAITHMKDQRRAFWIGFAVFGWGYIMYSTFFRMIPTRIVVEYLAQAAVHMSQFRFSSPHERDAFLAAGHCLWSLIFAGMGGMLNSYLWSRHERPARPEEISENPIPS